MTEEDRVTIENGSYFKVEFPGGYFFANKAYFGKLGMGLGFTFRGSNVGFVDTNRITDVVSSGSSIDIRVE